MALATFYHPELDSNDQLVELSEAESAHALKSRRLREGAPIQLINGHGLVAQGVIAATQKRSVSVRIQAIKKHPKPALISIATAIPKGDRQRNMLDMLTQLGVSEIIPLHCEHSVTHFKTAMRDKWERVTIEACKQSQNPWVPRIRDAVRIDELIACTNSQLMYADANGSSMFDYCNSCSELPNEIIIMIGPEGGFSEQEIKLLRHSDCTAISLASTILRTELACVSALAQTRLVFFMKDI